MSTPSGSGTFTGVSTYSSDLQQVLTRAVSIASLPLNLLQSQLTTLNSSSTELTSLDTTFGSVLSSLSNIDSSVNSATAVGSNSAVATLQASSAALPGTYSLNVLDPGSQTSAISNSNLPAVTDPSSTSITSATSLTLTVGSSTYTINPASNSLNDLAAAINSSGAGVSASVVNLGPPSAPNYQLSIQNQALGNTQIQLNDGSQDLLSILVAGSDAQYQINGQPSTPIFSNSQTITIAPGVTAILLQEGTSNIVVSRTASSLGNTLSSFAAAYNAAIDALTANRGTGTGGLSGDPVILTLQQSLHTLVNYTGGSGSVQNLAAVGLSVDKTGHLTFDQSVLNSANPQDVASFLGSATTGGFLQTATNTLNQLEDPNTGTFVTEQNSFQSEIVDKNNQISAEQSRIDQLQTSLTAQISAADALIAGLQQQLTNITDLFASINGTTTKTP